MVYCCICTHVCPVKYAGSEKLHLYILHFVLIVTSIYNMPYSWSTFLCCSVGSSCTCIIVLEPPGSWMEKLKLALAVVERHNIMKHALAQYMYLHLVKKRSWYSRPQKRTWMLDWKEAFSGHLGTEQSWICFETTVCWSLCSAGVRLRHRL